MLLIFWDIKENSVIKKAVQKALIATLNKIINNELLFTGYEKYAAKVILTDSSKIRRLNKTYREIDKETDVLSFAELDLAKNLPALKEEKSLGEIYINYNWIKKDKKPKNLVTELFLHGYLHLLGFDHEKDHGEMEKLENKLRKMIARC